MIINILCNKMKYNICILDSGIQLQDCFNEIRFSKKHEQSDSSASFKPSILNENKSKQYNYNPNGP